MTSEPNQKWQEQAGWGTHAKVGDQDVLQFVRVIDASRSDIWRYLTDPNELLKWWGLAFIDGSMGGVFVLRWLNDGPDGEPAVMHSRITQWNHEELLETKGDIHGTLRWELKELYDEHTQVTFSSRLKLPTDFVSSTLAGWHFHLDGLAGALSGGAVERVDFTKNDWNEIHTGYQQRLASEQQ